jgi:hypothetical protein
MTSFRHEWANAQSVTAPTTSPLKTLAFSVGPGRARLQPGQKEASSEGAYRSAEGWSGAVGATTELPSLIGPQTPNPAITPNPRNPTPNPRPPRRTKIPGCPFMVQFPHQV